MSILNELLELSKTRDVVGAKRAELSSFVKDFEDPTNAGNKNKRTVTRRFHKWVNDLLAANSGMKRKLPPALPIEKTRVPSVVKGAGK